MELLGSGKLQKNFEELKEKLKKEGLFDSKHKKPIPPLPRHIALITSPTGAAIRDILQILRRRFKGLKITVIPALVQGDGAPESLIQALKQACLIPSLDSLIIGRGGGSQEDLWAFNSEDLAYEIFKCKIPVISAVGHEIDFTICDFVADLRAPTPSAAAELIVQNATELKEKITKIKKQLLNSAKFYLQVMTERLKSLSSRLIHPEKHLQNLYQRTDELSSQLILCLKNTLQRERKNLDHLTKLLTSLNPTKVMERGFCIATKENKQIITDSKQTPVKTKIHLQFFKGHAEVTVNKKGSYGV